MPPPLSKPQPSRHLNHHTYWSERCSLLYERMPARKLDKDPDSAGLSMRLSRLGSSSICLSISGEYLGTATGAKSAYALHNMGEQAILDLSVRSVVGQLPADSINHMNVISCIALTSPHSSGIFKCGTQLRLRPRCSRPGQTHWAERLGTSRTLPDQQCTGP